MYGRYMSVGSRRVENCVWQDVTKRKEAEAALLRSEKPTSADRMAATVAHEINNPLSAVTNCIYLAASNPSLPPEVKEYLATAERELRGPGQVAERLIREVLCFVDELEVQLMRVGADLWRWRSI